jgi:2-polyprenyl-3-methyl-5-hydroxy-6-metoxy-1,4-benzoquinol methylase
MGSRRKSRRHFHDTLKAIRTKAHVEGSGLLGRVLLRRFGPPRLPAWVMHAGVRQHHSILEAGCGSGSLLLQLQAEGFRNLAGVDPFIERDLRHGELQIRKATVAEIEGQFDFVVLEHAFEHIPQPRRVLSDLCSRLKPTGVLILSIPLLGYAWERYGVNWVQLDAPRHLYLHTEKSMRVLASGIAEIADVVYDSGPVQFWGSEQYERDIPLRDARSHRMNGTAVTAAAMAKFEQLASDLNRAGRGDQATFYLRRQ